MLLTGDRTRPKENRAEILKQKDSQEKMTQREWRGGRKPKEEGDRETTGTKI